MGRRTVGLIPAGGRATRIAPLPGSKEVFPIGFRADARDQRPRPKVVAHYLLENMRRAGAREAYIVLREGKWDIPAYFGDGSMLDMHLAYLMLGLPHGPPYTLDQAYPFVRDATVVFGFPDILCEPQDGFVRLLDRQRETDADVVLGVFQAEDASGVDVCDLDEHGWVREVLPKPRPTQLRDAWLTAVWTPVFTEFMHDHLAAVQRESREPERELSVGHVLQAGVQAGLRVSSVRFADGVFIDIGTPDDLVRAVQMYAR